MTVPNLGSELAPKVICSLEDFGDKKTSLFCVTWDIFQSFTNRFSLFSVHFSVSLVVSSIEIEGFVLTNIDSCRGVSS